MSRLHLFEFEDLPWFPNALRELMTDYLSFLGEKMQAPYHDVTERLHSAMVACGQRRLVDLCTGGGGPAWTIASLLRQKHGYLVDLLLTDLYPNRARLQRLKDAATDSVDYCPDSIDATRVPPSISGFRLLCNGFHHFRKDQAQAILEDAVKQQQGIAIIEVLERSVPGFVQVLFLCGLPFLVTPFIRPFRLSRLFFTYVIPVVPLFILWDGMVSCLRIYSPAELEALVASLSTTGESPPYEWEIGQTRVPWTPVPITYLIGYPPRSRSLRSPSTS